MVGTVPAPHIPGYRDLAPLGHGGFSEVYRAYQERFDRWVAVKVLTFTLADDRAQRRFLRECRVAGRLSAHPNIVTVYDADLAPDGRPYISMELFDRGSIGDRLRRSGPFDVADALRIAISLAGALETAHRAGVVHRDVKPANVLLAAYGQPALTDFGLSILAERHELSVGVDALTPYHAAPEVLERTSVSAASDVYSLASTTYATLAGRAPHQQVDGPDSMAALLLRILQVDVPPLGRSDVPRSLDVALRAGLARDMSVRTPTALAFAQGLQLAQRELGLEVTEPVVFDVAKAGDAGPASLPGTPAPATPGGDGGMVPDFAPAFGTAAVPGDATVDRAHLPAAATTSLPGRPPAATPVPPAATPVPPAASPVPPGPAPGQPPPPAAPYPPGAGTDGGPGFPTRAPAGAPGAWPTGPGARANPVDLDPETGLPLGWAGGALVDGEATVHRQQVRGDRPAPLSTPAPRRSTLKVVLVVLTVIVAATAAALAVFALVRGADDPAPSGGDGTSGTTGTTAAPGSVEVPTNVTATESQAGVQVDWDGEEPADYTVLVLSEAESPRALPANGPSALLIADGTLRPDVGYCFSVARVDVVNAAPEGEASNAFSAPVCIRGASQSTVRVD